MAKPNTSSAVTSSTRKTPRIFAVSSMWKKASRIMIASVPNSNTQTGMSTPNQSLMVVLAKYAVTPVTPAAKSV